MSAIFGIFRRDTDPLDPDHLPLMRDALAHRGPDGLTQWQDQRVGLGHAMLATTPDALSTPIPYCTRNIVLTCDARLDNRAELASALGMDLPSDSQPADTELIAAAYERWGDGFPAKLEGAFAIAIWDESQHKLICTRDALGLKSLYIHTTSQLFVFATEIKGILALPTVPRRINEQCLADYLLFHHSNLEQTFFEGVVRLPPAHTLIITPQSTRLEAYWQLDPHRETLLDSDEAYIEAFRDLLLSAVQGVMRSSRPVGVMLSGGLDSSTVASIGRRYLPAHQTALLAFTGIAPTVPETDESEYVDQVIALGSIEPHATRIDTIGPFFDADRMLHHMEEPISAGNLFLSWAMMGLAQQKGARVLLTGIDGDNIVSHGFAYLAELAMSQRWNVFHHEAAQLQAHYNNYQEDLMMSYYYKYGFPAITRLAQAGRIPAALRAVWALSTRSGVSRQRLIKKYLWKRVMTPRPLNDTVVAISTNPAFAQRVDLTGRIDALNRAATPYPASERDAHYADLQSGMMLTYIEMMDRAGGAFGLDMRHPFNHKRLLEYSLSIPGHLKLHNGMTRYILREAMRGILPEPNRIRTGKTNLLPNFLRMLLAHEQHWLQEGLRASSERLGEYVDLVALHEPIQRVQSQPSTTDVTVVWRLLALDRWLQSVTS